MKKSVLTGCAAGVALAIQLAVGAGAAGAQPIATAPDCSSSYNPYDYTQAALAACGVQTSTNTTTTTLSGGGTEDNYTLQNGSVAHIFVPPAGFDPLNATTAQLAEYGFPAEPTTGGLQAIENWQAFVAPLKDPQPAPPFLASGKASADTVTTPNWSGYAVTGTTFTSSLAEWYEPSYGSSFCTSNSAVVWTGIGGYNNADLGQDGTAWSNDGSVGLAQHQAWWEALPQIGSVQGLNLIVPTGHLGAAITDWTGSSYDGIVADDSTGGYQPWAYAGSFSGVSGEAITERPKYGSTFGDLSNFGTMTYTGAQENYVSVDQYSPTGGRHGVHMLDSGGSLMAAPSGVGSGGTFTDTQYNCQ